MILDNADDSDVFFQGPKTSSLVSAPSLPLADYIPRARQGSVLITTRDKRVSQRLSDRHMPIVLRPMDLEEGRELIQSQLHSEASYVDGDMLSLLEALDYLPLAITQAAAFINENSTTIAGYLKLLASNDSDLQDLLDEDYPDHRRGFDRASSVIRTWKLSFDLINERKPRAAQMLSLMAILDRQGIPKSLLKRDDDREVEILTALGTLQAFFLINVGKDGETYELHRLVQLVTQRWLELNGTKEKMQHDALFLLSERFPDGTFETWTECAKLLPHAEKVIQYEYTDEAGQLSYAHLLSELASYDHWQGRYELSYTRRKAALEIRENLLGSDNRQTLEIMLGLAITLRKTGRWKDAEKLNRRYVATTKRVFGAEDSLTLISMTESALMLENRGQYSDAEQLLVSVTTTYRKLGKLEDEYMLGSMCYLARMYFRQCRFKEAEELERQVLELKKRVLGARHPGTLASMNNLALAYYGQGLLPEAEELFLNNLQVEKSVYPQDHPETLMSMANLAGLYLGQDRLLEAEQVLVRIIEARKTQLGTEHPETLRSMHDLAFSYAGQGRFEEAATLYKEVLECRKRVLGAEHKNTLTTMNNLANAYNTQGNHNEAIELLKAAVEGYTRTLGPDHEYTLRSIEHLKRWEKAKVRDQSRLQSTKMWEDMTVLSALDTLYQLPDLER